MLKIPPIYSSFEYKNALKRPAVNRKKAIEELSEAKMRELFPKVHNKILLKALVELSQVEFESNDISYINSLGAKLSFISGREVVDYLSANDTKIKFDKTSVKGVFAQYNYKDNVVIISSNYSNSYKQADILAIAEAVLHEAGHAKDKDPYNSVQEEIDNLALNALAHNYFSKKYPGVFASSNSPIVKDGVNLYSSLFFDNDPDKKALVERLRQKYGHLQSGDTIHPFSVVALRVKGL